MTYTDLFYIGEFFSIAFVVTALYLTISFKTNTVKPATKMLISMFFGTVAYSISKLALLTFIIPFFSL